MGKLFKREIGITLIALVVTIIVLLILAGVTIVTLTGDNGILTKVGDAKNTNENAEIEEEIRLAWNKVYADSYLDNYTAEQKASELQTELSKNGNTATVSESGNKLSISYRGKDKVLDITTGTVKELSAVAKAISAGTVFDEKNTPITDEDGNTFIVPKGFKLASDSAEVVTEGIVIEDATYTDTIGSQFVWIPVGIPKKINSNETITLGRYSFASDGTPRAFSISSYVEEDSSNRTYNYRNTVAKDINDFISKTNAAGGFWIGRYEARTGTARSNKKDTLTQITEKATDYVYNYVTQPQAAEIAQGMYTSNSYFESDLINSYAWDTATLFLQEYDNRASNPKVYSRQNSLNTSFSSTGTTTDKICNVYDMASNCFEWTTETFGDYSNTCVGRGGYYSNSGYYPCVRGGSSTITAGDSCSFRPILYVKQN